MIHCTIDTLLPPGAGKTYWRQHSNVETRRSITRQFRTLLACKSAARGQQAVVFRLLALRAAYLHDLLVYRQGLQVLHGGQRGQGGL